MESRLKMISRSVIIKEEFLLTLKTQMMMLWIVAKMKILIKMMIYHLVSLKNCKII